MSISNRQLPVVGSIAHQRQGADSRGENVLNETALSPQYLELELTESLLLSNAEMVFDALQDLPSAGRSGRSCSRPI